MCFSHPPTHTHTHTHRNIHTYKYINKRWYCVEKYLSSAGCTALRAARPSSPESWTGWAWRRTSLWGNWRVSAANWGWGPRWWPRWPRSGPPWRSGPGEVREQVLWTWIGNFFLSFFACYFPWINKNWKNSFLKIKWHKEEGGTRSNSWVYWTKQL